jgi:hypothetical protein
MKYNALELVVIKELCIFDTENWSLQKMGYRIILYDHYIPSTARLNNILKNEIYVPSQVEHEQVRRNHQRK